MPGTLAGLLLALAAVSTHAAEVVKIVVPFAPGGPGDQIARIISPALQSALGKVVVVENRGGAGGTLGAAYAAKSAPDGSTLLLTTSSLVLSAGTMRSLPYDPRKDLEPVYLLGEVQTMLAVRSSLGVKTLAELVARAKASPKPLNYGSTGVGGTMHVGAELFAKTAGVPLTHIPYRGAGPALVDLIAGTVDLVNADVPVLRPYIQDGRVKGLVIFDTQRSPLLPEVPTAQEAGMPALQMTNWYGVLVPAQMPPDPRRRLAEALARVVHQPDVAARLAEAGFSRPQDTEAFRKRLDGDFDRWLPWLKAADIHTD